MKAQLKTSQQDEEWKTVKKSINHRKQRSDLCKTFDRDERTVQTQV